MSMAPQLAVMTLAGALCGATASVLAASMRGQLVTRVMLHRLAYGLAAIPGVALLHWMAPTGGPAGVFRGMELVLVFLVAYGGSGIGTHTWLSSTGASRESAVPFQHWLELLRTDPPAAHHFLNAYLTDRGSHALRELRAVHALLEGKQSREPHMLLALDQLRAEITRREGSGPVV